MSNFLCEHYEKIIDDGRWLEYFLEYFMEDTAWQYGQWMRSLDLGRLQTSFESREIFQHRQNEVRQYE